MLTLVMWVIFGWVVGAAANWLMPGETPAPAYESIAMGIAGSILGGMVAAILSGDGYHPAGLFASVLGALACLYAWRHYVKG